MFERSRLFLLSVEINHHGEDLSSIYRLLEGKGSDVGCLEASLGEETDLDDIWKVLFGATPPSLATLNVTFWRSPLYTLHLPLTSLPTLTIL